MVYVAGRTLTRLGRSNKVNKGETKPELYDQYGLPTIKNTWVTLDAGNYLFC